MSTPKTRTEKLWIGGGTIGVVVLAAVIWTVVVSPKLSEADTLTSQSSDTQLQNSTLQARINTLKLQEKHIGALRGSLAQAQAALPNGSAMPAFISQVQAQARRTHVVVTSLTAGNPAPAVSAAPAGTATPAPANSSGPTPAATGATPGKTAAPASGLYSIPITVVVTGTPAAELSFVAAMEHSGPRATSVTAAALTSGQAAGSTGGDGITVQLQIFSTAVPAAATPSASTNHP